MKKIIILSLLLIASASWAGEKEDIQKDQDRLQWKFRALKAEAQLIDGELKKTMEEFTVLQKKLTELSKKEKETKKEVKK